MPSEPAESNFKDKVKITAYRCHERNGVVWTYMGSRVVPPPLPELEGNMHDAYHITVLHRACNWMQGLEGEMDTLHVTFLHLGHLNEGNTEPGTFNHIQASNREGKFHVRETPHGTSYGMVRSFNEGEDYWRIGHILFPFYAMVPGIENPLGNTASFLAYVPQDDHHTLEWSVRALKPGETPGDQQRVYLPNTTDWHGRYNIDQNFENNFLIDREAQRKNESFTGIKGIRQQDMAMTESMGSIYDRTKEHLGTTDQMIIRTRRRFMAAARDLAEDGSPPPGVDTPSVYHQRSGQVALPQAVDWWESTKELRETFNVKPPVLEASG